MYIRMEKIKYELDPHNRLTVKSSSLRGIRKVLDGQFKISGHNTLTYHIKIPVPADIKAPHQVKLKGEWSLTKEHQLRLTLDKWQRQTFGDQLTIQGEIIDVKKNSLAFAVAARTKDNLPSTYILELSGCWQADEHNRLTFRADKEHGRTDLLVFDAAWQIGDNYQIIYNYEKANLVRRNRSSHTLIFKGRWEIKDKFRLSYLVGGDTDSGFDFQAGLGVFRDDCIKYEIGIGLSRKREPVKRVVIFSGKWKASKAVGLVFEVEQDAKKIQAMVFGAEVKLTSKGSVLLKLRNSLNEKIGAELELSQDIFKGKGQAFLRLLKSKQESAIMAGAAFNF